MMRTFVFRIVELEEKKRVGLVWYLEAQHDADAWEKFKVKYPNAKRKNCDVNRACKKERMIFEDGYTIAIGGIFR